MHSPAADGRDACFSGWGDMNIGDKVVVVGAGPVGLTVACELAAHGIVPRVIDRSRRQTIADHDGQ